MAPIPTLASPPDYLHGSALPAAVLLLADYAFCFNVPWSGDGLVLAGVGFVALLAAAFLAMTYIPASRPRDDEESREAGLSHSFLFEVSPYPAWVYDRETLAFLSVNDAALRRYGYTREEFLRMTIKDIRPAEEVPRLMDYLAQRGEERTTLDQVWKHQTKNGSVIYVEITSVEVGFRSRPSVLVMAHDVTKRVRAEEALRRAEEKYRSIFENAVEGVFQSTPDGRFIAVNPAMARMFGFDSPEQMMAERTDIGRQHYVDPAAREERTRMIEERGVVLGFVAECYRRGGGRLWTSSNTRAVRDASGAVCHYEGFVQEITDRVRAEERELTQKRLVALRADINAALTRGGASLNDILQQSAEAMVRHLDAAFARIWTLNQSTNLLELQASAGIYTNLDGKYARVPVGSFKIGLIAAERAPHLTNDVQGDERIGDREWARRERLVSFAGYPLMVEGRLVGVMGMFARRPLRQDTLDALSSVADTIAQGVERVRAEAALRDSELKFRRLIEEVHVGLLVAGGDGGILLSNGAAQRMFGLTAEQMNGKPYLDPNWEAVRDDGTPFPYEDLPIQRALSGRRPVRNVVMGIFRPSTGDRVWLLADAEPHLSEDGRVTEVLCTLTDITERKQAEEALRLSEERHRATLKAIPDLIFLLTRDGTHLAYHAKNDKDLTIPPERFMGKNIREVVPPEMAETFISCFERATLTGETQVCEYTLFRDGRERLFEGRVVSCDDDKILLVARDVTEHKQTETERTQLLGRLVNAQEEERARLAREVHDEFAAYLTALNWGIGSLGHVGGLPPRAESELSYLLGLTTRLQHQVRDFAFELSPAELDDEGGLPAALERYIGRLAERVGDRLGLEFRRVGFDASRHLPREVEIALYRAAQEALTNVLKHADARSVRLTLGFYLEEPGCGVVSLIVEDDGVGFAPAQGAGAECGFGLKGMGERIALLGGHLNVSSGDGGTTLTVTVPVSVLYGEGGDGNFTNTDRR